MEHIFLEAYEAVACYSHRDMGLVRRLREDLRNAGIKVWTGDHLKPESDYWASSIQEALRHATALLVVLTPNARYAPEIRLATQIARQQHVPIYPLLLQGDSESATPDALRGIPVIDLRNQAIFYQNLATPELVQQLQERPRSRRFIIKFWNPAHQLRLLLWLFWTPRRVVDYQEEHGTEPVRKTAGWLATWLFFLVLLIGIIEEELHNIRLVSGARLFFWVTWGTYIALMTQPERRFWVNYRDSALMSLGLMCLLLPGLLALLLRQYPDLPPVRPGRLVTIACMVLIGAIALGIVETFQLRGSLGVVLVMVNALLTALGAAWVAATSVVSSIGTGIVAIGLLTLLGIAAGSIAIIVLYGLAFLLANDLVRALYTRGTTSRPAQSIPVIVGLSYLVLAFVGAF